jgi:hypothetical protein
MEPRAVSLNLRWSLSFGLVASLVPPTPARAQARHGGQPDTASAPIIRAIVIDRGEVFDSAEARSFWGFALVNALHAQTRPYVVRRELLFGVGERFDTARVNESARNLRALSIFRDVEIDTVSTDSGVTVRVRTTDGWTTNLGFGIRTSGRERVINAFVQEINLLGTRTIATLGYESDPDRNTVIAGFDTPRLIANRVGVGASYAQRSDGHSAGAGVRYPFFNLSSRGGASLNWGLFDGRVLHYEQGTRIPEDSARREFALLRGDAAVALRASPRGYVRLGVTGQLRRDDLGPEGGTAALPRTITVAAGPYIAFRAPRYIQVRNYEAMGRVEDVDLGPTARADVALAPKAWGYERDGVGGRLSASVGLKIPTGFAQLGGSVGGLRSSAGVDSSSLDGSVLAVAQPADRHLFVANVSGGRLNDPPFGVEYDIGLGYGVRAFPSHAFTGDRFYLANAEYRWLAVPRFLGLLGLGVAGFADHGGAWFRRQERRSGTDMGIGLRIGSIRSAGSIVGRLDLAYRFENDREPGGWVVSLGRGFGWQRF